VVSLPILPVPDTSEEAPRTEENHALPPSRILVVDDEPPILDLIAAILETDGHEVVRVDRAEAALERLERESFDAILCDIRMPGMDGKALTEAIRQRRPELARRILFVTGDLLDDETERFLRERGYPWMEKPFDSQELRNAIAKVLAESAP
jgi:CheY-like chemotaxis protein